MDLNEVANLGSVLKRQVYRDGRQVSFKASLWEAILDTSRASIAEQIPSIDGIYGLKDQDSHFKQKILHILFITIFTIFQMLNVNFVFSYY